MCTIIELNLHVIDLWNCRLERRTTFMHQHTEILNQSAHWRNLLLRRSFQTQSYPMKLVLDIKLDLYIHVRSQYSFSASNINNCNKQTIIFIFFSLVKQIKWYRLSYCFLYLPCMWYILIFLIEFSYFPPFFFYRKWSTKTWLSDWYPTNTK